MTFSETLTLLRRYTNTTGNLAAYSLADQTMDINNALNQYFILANSASGNWRPADDTNQTKYPVIKTDIVSAQQDYSFTVDEQGNQILDIYKVRILNPDGINWTTLRQINQDTITDGDLQTVTGSVPQGYYLTANGIFLVQKPNYSMTAGLEVWINRTPTYFTVSDTTKKAGLPWVHHEYLSIRPAYYYCAEKGLPQAGGRLRNGGYTGYLMDLMDFEEKIKKYWRDRNRDFSQTISPETINSI
jgi:hypothetical protein